LGGHGSPHHPATAHIDCARPAEELHLGHTAGPIPAWSPNDDATTPALDPLHGDTAELRQQRISYRLLKITFPK
jgi:hypothetical protein